MYCYHNSPGVNTLKEIATSFHFVSKIRDDKRGVFVIINIILSLGKTAFMASPPKATKSSKECKPSEDELANACPPKAGFVLRFCLMYDKQPCLSINQHYLITPYLISS
jgi:hypothetical protein